MAKAYVYTCRSVKFVVEGTQYDVSELTMNLAVSAIPEVNLSIAPEKSSEGTAHIYPMSLYRVHEALGELLEKSEKFSKCSLNIVLEKHDASTGATVFTQELNLENWILCAAGLEDVTTTSSFYVKVTIRHPIYRLSLYGGFWSNMDVCPNIHGEIVQSSSDLIDAGVKAYDTLLNAINSHPLRRLSLNTGIPPTLMEPPGIMGIIRGKFNDVPDLIRDFLKWDPVPGGGEDPFPVWKLLSDTQKMAMRELCASTWLYSEGSAEHSVWDAFMNLISSMDAVLVPEFWKNPGDQLTVTPRFPWMKPDFGVDERDTYLLTLPGSDPCPIFGLSGTPETVGGNDFRMVTYNYDSTELEESRSDATSLAFVPEEEYDSNGKFMTVPMPSWLSSVLSKGAGYNDQMNTLPNMEGEKPPPEDPGGGENEATKHKNDCEMMYLSTVFQRSFKEFVEARVNCVFMPKPVNGGESQSDDWVIPTRVMEFVTDNGPIFEGYITTVSHTVSMVSGNATTNIGLSHCRPPGGYPMIVNGYDYHHPLYWWG